MNHAELIKSKLNIVDIIQDFITLKKKGTNYTGNCPFHNEKTPSFVVFPNGGNDSKGNYKCFGCGASGDMIKFVEDYEGLNFNEALQFLAKKAGVEIKANSNETSNVSAIFNVNNIAANYYKSQIKLNDYLEKRGFDFKIVDDFNIGFVGEAWDGLLNFLKSKSYSPTFLHDAGLISKKNNDYYFDKFRNRVIFPIYSVSGQVVAFSGRTIEENPKIAKYLNSPETAVFVKGKHLFGLLQAKKAIQHENIVYIVEGNTDVLRFHQKEIKNTVAPLGTAFTDHQAKLISRFCDNVCFVLDGDKAGRNATLKSIPIALKAGLTVYAVSLPDGQDPDTFAKEMDKLALQSYLENESKEWHDFLMPHKNINTADKTDAIQMIIDCINAIPDKIKRQSYIDAVALQTGIEKSILATGVVEIKETESIWPLNQLKDEIKNANEARVYLTKQEAMNEIAKGSPISISITEINDSEIKTLKSATNQLFVQYQITDENIEIPKKLTELGFEVKVYNELPGLSNESFGSGTFVSFTDWFISYMYQKTPTGHFDAKRDNLQELARHLSFLDETTIKLAINEISKRFSITKSDFKDIIKPLIQNKKAKTNFLNESVEIDGSQQVFDIENLPAYVDQKFFNKYHFFPAQNQNGKKIFYVFRNPEGSSLQKIGNFYIEPLFHLYSPESNKNKRIIQLNNADGRTTKFMEVPSKDMVSLQNFRGLIFETGGFVATGMKPFHFEQIIDSISHQFPITYELETFGQQEENFWAFSNAILTEDGEIKHMNDLGLVSYKNKTYYSPAVSKIYNDVRNRESLFEQDHFFKINTPQKPTSFEDWGKLMLEVYKYNDVGYWAIIMTIMSAFRSDIFTIDRLFTTIFFVGPTECGKSQIAQSIRAIYMHPDAPMFNLNSGTDAAFFTMLERYRDVPIIMEEYNDMQISDTKFQGLKAAIYDGEGRTKRKSADSKTLDVSKVNSIPILLGQESPERDDGSLSNRLILLHIKKKDDWTQHEKDVFTQLKEVEKNGLSNILIEILKQRKTIRSLYKKRLRTIQKDLTFYLQKENIRYQTRILNTVSLFLTMVEVWENNVNTLKLPFTYKQFKQVAIKKLIDQSELISSTNRLSVFFDTILNLSMRTHNGIKHGKEFIIDTVDSIDIRINRDEIKSIRFDEPTRLIFLRLTNIHPLYKQEAGMEYLKMNNLLSYIKDSPAYIGSVKSWKFEWEEESREERNEFAVSVIKKKSQYSSAIVMNYDKLGIDFGNYAIKNPVEKQPENYKQQTIEVTDDDLPY